MTDVIAAAVTPAPRRHRASGEAAFRARVEERLDNVEGQLAEVKSRLNGLLFFIASTVIAQVLLKVVRVSLAPLRPYQREVVRAVLGSVHDGDGETFSVEIARQGGKNELSARIELALLASNADRDCTLVKAAPTLRPQARISFDRLWDRITDAGFGPWAKRAGSDRISLGRATQVFLSAERQSNIVGHTASLLLEIDEAQDVDVEKFDRELRPMAASTGATTVLYGTAWDSANLLERAKQTHLEAERRDGRRRHFEYDWETVGRENAVYDRFARQERDRLGAEHPVFLSQYCLRVLPGAGRLLSPTALSLLQGRHARLDGPIAGDAYVTGLDVAGAGEGAHDATVLTIARVYGGGGSLKSAVEADAHGGDPAVGTVPLTPTLSPGRGSSETVAREVASTFDAGFAARDGWSPQVEVVRHYEWTGAPLLEVEGALLSLLQHTWRVTRVCVDATGIGEPIAAHLRGGLGSRVEAVKLSAERKSELGFDLIAAANAGRLRLYDGDAVEGRECRRQLERCRAHYRPNRTLAFAVDTAEGHDDYVVSLALAVAAGNVAQPRRARGRAGRAFTGGGPSWS